MELEEKKLELDLEELMPISHTTVSNLSHEPDELVTEFRTLQLRAYYPYLYIDLVIPQKQYLISFVWYFLLA